MFGFFNSQPENYIDLSREAFKGFHNAMTSYSNYRMSLDELIDFVKGPAKADYLNTLGWTISQNEFDSSEIEEAMEDLAEKCQGQLPDRWQDAQLLFVNAIGKKAQDFSWMKAVKFTAVESAKDIVHGAQEVGDTIIGTAKVFQVLIPIALVGAAIFIFVKRTKQAAG